MKRLHVAVLGMGVGGLSAAALLARAGHRVTAYDAMPSPGPVGSGFVLQPTGLAALGLMGLREATETRGARIDRLLGRLHDGTTVLDVGYGSLHAVAIQRQALFDVLHGAALHAGVEAVYGSRIDFDPATPDQASANGTALAGFDLLVDALGSRTPASKAEGSLGYGALWATVPWGGGHGFSENTLEQRYRRASEMAGVLPVGTAREGSPACATVFWSVRNGEDLRDWRSRALSLWPEIEAFLPKGEPVHAVYRHHTLKPVPTRRTVRVGDSWHATSPQLGQGANMALLDAVALSDAMRQPTLPDALKAYARSRTAHVRFYQALSVVLTPFYQSDSRMLPVIRDRIIAPMLRRRGLAHAAISSMVRGNVMSGRSSAQTLRKTDY